MFENKIVKFDVENWQKLTLKKNINNKFLFQLIPFFKSAKDDQVVFIYPKIKKQIAEKMGWNETNYLSRCSCELNRLRDAEVITRLDQSVYQLNPNYIGIGDDEAIEKLKQTFEIKKPRQKKSKFKTETETSSKEISQKNFAKNNSGKNKKKKHSNINYQQQSNEEVKTHTMDPRTKALLERTLKQQEKRRKEKI